MSGPVQFYLISLLCPKYFVQDRRSLESTSTQEKLPFKSNVMVLTMKVFNELKLRDQIIITNIDKSDTDVKITLRLIVIIDVILTRKNI